MTFLCANMVVRNEADNYLERVLTRLSTQVDMICITDDCSDDNTVEVASSFDKVKIHSLPKPMFSINEGELRQASWEWLESNIDQDEPTFILAIDADEELYETTYSLQRIINAERVEIANIMFFHMWNEYQFRIDGGWRPHGSTRLFRYHKGDEFLRRKIACGSEPIRIAESMRNPQFIRQHYVNNSGLAMKHLSYIKDEDKRKKHERYMSLDKGDFHALNHIQSIVDPPERVQLETWSFG